MPCASSAPFRSRAVRLGLLLALAGGVGIAGAQDELWIDGPDAVQPGNNREFPGAAIDAFGNSIYVWDAFLDMTVRNDIYLRRFAPDGSPFADPVQVNELVADDQRTPRVAAGLDGSFVVVWRSEEPGPEPTDPSGHWVRSRKFAADGDPVGVEQYVNVADAAIAGGALRVDVAALSGGGYVVVWRSAAGGTDAGIGILARRLSAAGVPLGSPFQVNVQESSSQDHPAVAGLRDGGFVVAWTVPGVALRRFAADGTPVTGQIDVNASALNGFGTDVAAGHDGRVAVVWMEGGTEIRARLYDDPTVAPLGGEFRVSSALDTDPDAPQVATWGQHEFIVVWESTTGVGSDADGRSVQGRRVTGVNQFAGPQEQLNEHEVDAQHQPAVGGRSYWIALAWQSGDNPAENDDAILGFGIDLCDGVFCDDFELGSTLRWSSASP